MKIDKIAIIEKRHPELSITVIGYDKNVHHLYKSQNHKGNEKIIDLLLISDTNNNSHYVWIKDLSRLLSYDLSTKNGKKYKCRNCLPFKYSEEALAEHRNLCLQAN